MDGGRDVKFMCTKRGIANLSRQTPILSAPIGYAAAADVNRAQTKICMKPHWKMQRCN